MVAGCELSVMVRADTIGTSAICAYYFEGYEHSDNESGPCYEFLGEIGLAFSRDRPKRALIVRQQTEHDLVIPLTQRDLEKLQHLHKRWQRRVEREDVYAKWEDTTPEDINRSEI
jgi:hypothetical protein